MKTKDECLLEAQNHFGIKVFANDDGITRRIWHRAMELFSNQQNANLTNLYKIEVEANEKLRRLHQQSEEQNAQLRKEVERLNTCVKTYSDMSLRAQEQILEMEKQIGNWKVLSELNSKESILKGLEIVRLTKEVEELKKSVTPNPFLYPINSVKLKELVWKLDREVWAKVEAKEATTSWAREQTSFLISQYFGQSSNELTRLRELLGECETWIEHVQKYDWQSSGHELINKIKKTIKP